MEITFKLERTENGELKAVPQIESAEQQEVINLLQARYFADTLIKEYDAINEDTSKVWEMHEHHEVLATLASKAIDEGKTTDDLLAQSEEGYVKL